MIAMNCHETKERLSAYFDDELSGEERARVQAHVESCTSCTEELAEFRSLSTLARQSPPDEPPAEIWQRIAASLDSRCASVAPRRPAIFQWLAMNRFRGIAVGFAAAAALVLVAVWLIGIGGRHDDMAAASAVFDRYLSEFHSDPHAAQQRLLAEYDGHTLDPARAVQLVGYRPAVAGGLPQGYAVESTYVMKMPCCTCVQSLCKRSDGTMLAIFEHDSDQTKQWFGDRPEASAICNGTQCRIVELNEGIAAKWQRGTRHITVVGARDTTEIGQLAAWLADRS